MGSGIAQVFAAQGFPVLLADVREEFVARGLDAIRRSLARLVKKGELPESGAADALGRILPTIRLEDARDAALAVEAVPEDPPLKEEVFRDLDRTLPPAAILAT